MSCERKTGLGAQTRWLPQSDRWSKLEDEKSESEELLHSLSSSYRLRVDSPFARDPSDSFALDCRLPRFARFTSGSNSAMSSIIVRASCSSCASSSSTCPSYL